MPFSTQVAFKPLFNSSGVCRRRTWRLISSLSQDANAHFERFEDLFDPSACWPQSAGARVRALTGPGVFGPGGSAPTTRGSRTRTSGAPGRGFEGKPCKPLVLRNSLTLRKAGGGGSSPQDRTIPQKSGPQLPASRPGNLKQRHPQGVPWGNLQWNL